MSMREEDYSYPRNELGQSERVKSIKIVNSSEHDGTNYRQQYQTILNLYHSGIPTYIIAFQLDMDEKDVHKVIQSTLEGTNSLWLTSSSSVSLLENKFTGNTLNSNIISLQSSQYEILNTFGYICFQWRSISNVKL